MTRLATVVALLAASPVAAEDPGVCLVRAAREQIGVTVRYDGAYRSIPYPDGDIPLDRGVCTDVIIRAYRRLRLDLQALVHDDMKAAWSSYPNPWRLPGPDPNIDHRRVLNLVTFLGRHADVLPIGRRPALYASGDIVTWRLPSGTPHIGIVSDRVDASGSPLVIHNIGRGTREEGVLFRHIITGHYRYLPAHPSGCG